MNNPEITSLYKYREYNQYSLQSLINSTAWFAKPLSFNDPFDCNPNYSNQFTPSVRKEFIEILKAKSGNDFDESYIETYIRETNRYINNSGILCLSGVCDDILMWSHYADSHRGFVIEYERSKRNYLGKSAIPVLYTDELPSLSPIDVLERKKESQEKLWLYKSTHWKYEKEWRCYIDFGGTEQPLGDVKIKSIIFGLKMGDREISTIKNILKKQNIIFKKTHKSPREFHVDIYNH